MMRSIMAFVTVHLTSFSSILYSARKVKSYGAKELSMERFTISAKPAAVNIVYQSADVRISLVTPCLLRVEKGTFTDLPTQCVL